MITTSLWFTGNQIKFMLRNDTHAINTIIGVKVLLCQSVHFFGQECIYVTALDDRMQNVPQESPDISRYLCSCSCSSCCIDMPLYKETNPEIQSE